MNRIFDHETAANLINGKKVDPDLIKRFVFESKWTNQEVNYNRNQITDLILEIRRRDSEIALLKEMLLDLEDQVQMLELSG